MEIVKAPPFALIQDLGFPRGRAWGLPRGGAMDPGMLCLANKLVDNPHDAAAIEWAVGPGTLRFERDTRVAALPGCMVHLGKTRLDPRELVFTAPARVAVSIEPGPQHRFSYIAVAGGIAVPQVLGSSSTYLPAGIGGHQGRLLRSGDRLKLGKGPGPRVAVLDVTASDQAEAVMGDRIVRVTRGPQWARFAEPAREAFFTGRFTTSPTSDRMGCRLLGPLIHTGEAASLPSEAACPGAVQIPDSGEPIVLLPDGPTVGGYLKLAVVVRADLRALAQCPPSRGLRFREVSLEQARACYSEAS